MTASSTPCSWLFDRAEQVLPGVDEVLRAFILQLPGQRRNVDAGAGDVRQHILCIAAVPRHRAVYLPWLEKASSVSSGMVLMVFGAHQRTHVEHVGRLRILGAGAGKQQALRPCAVILQTLPVVWVQQVGIRLACTL